MTIFPVVTLGLLITPPVAAVKALSTSSLTSEATPGPPPRAAAATASAATMTEAGRGGTGSDLEGLQLNEVEHYFLLLFVLGRRQNGPCILPKTRHPSKF